MYPATRYLKADTSQLRGKHEVGPLLKNFSALRTRTTLHRTTRAVRWRGGATARGRKRWWWPKSARTSVSAAETEARWCPVRDPAAPKSTTPTASTSPSGPPVSGSLSNAGTHFFFWWKSVVFPLENYMKHFSISRCRRFPIRQEENTWTRVWIWFSSFVGTFIGLPHTQFTRARPPGI